MSKKPIPLEIAKGVAAWWRKQGDVAHVRIDNGDHSGTGAALIALATMASREPRVTKEMWDRFELELARRVVEGLWGDSIGCDYGPDGYLVNAAQEAGFPRERINGSAYGGVFPIKSHTWAHPAYAEGSCGYAAEREVIAGEKPWGASTAVLDRGDMYAETVRSASYDNETWETSSYMFGIGVLTKGLEITQAMHGRAVQVVGDALSTFTREQVALFARTDRDAGLFEKRIELEKEFRKKVEELAPDIVWRLNT